MIEVIMDRWCIEDQIRPSSGRKIQMLVDLYTDENNLKLPLLNGIRESILELKVYGVNLGRELTYIKGDDHITIDLGNLDSWTSTKDSRGLTLIRLNLIFKIIDPNFILSKMDLGYKTFLDVYGYKLDKGSIIVPLGLKVENNGEIEIDTIMKCEKKTEYFKEKFQADHIDIHDKKKRYNFNVKKELREILDSENCETEIKVTYNTVNENKYFIIPIVSVAFLILALIRSYGLITGTTNFDIRYLAAAVAFLGLIINFIRDGYELPFRRLISLSLLILIVEVSLELIFLPYG